MSFEARVLIVFDGKAWFVRELHSTEHDMENQHKLYRAIKPISGPHRTPEVAVRSAKRWLKANR